MKAVAGTKQVSENKRYLQTKPNFFVRGSSFKKQEDLVK